MNARWPWWLSIARLFQRGPDAVVDASAWADAADLRELEARMRQGRPTPPPSEAQLLPCWPPR